MPKSTFSLILMTFFSKKKKIIFQMLPEMLLSRQVGGRTCRKGSAQGWCSGATRREHLRPRAVGGSPAAPAGPDHEAAAPPGHTSTSRAESAGSASTNTATTGGSPCLEREEKCKTKIRNSHLKDTSITETTAAQQLMTLDINNKVQRQKSIQNNTTIKNTLA